uniref:Uncharacterized protein n=1 Tax=Rhizophora mucronata TaxID=61149 RepID=A0A2P2PKZ6_RHIMU
MRSRYMEGHVRNSLKMNPCHMNSNFNFP